MQKEIHDEDMMVLVVAMGVNYDIQIYFKNHSFFVSQKRELNRFYILIVTYKKKSQIIHTHKIKIQ